MRHPWPSLRSTTRWRSNLWWHLPLAAVLIGAPFSLTISAMLASYGAAGPYGGFWRLFLAGLAASVPIFIAGGLFFAPVEIWLIRRPQRQPARRAALLRSGVLAVVSVVGALISYGIVVWLLPAAPPPTLLPVLLTTYPLIGVVIALTYTLYDEYVHQLRLISAQLTQEMRVARGIQQGLFPRQCPRIPGYSLAARCRPARETGGDFYDFYTFNDGRLGIVIADVAGKGMPAALLMANTRSVWRAEARHGLPPAETLRRINRSLWRDINTNGFVTLLYALLEPDQRRLCLANAGHPLPLVHNTNSLREIELYGLPLGLKSDATYEQVQLDLLPGDTMLLYTDGVMEALNASREMFGFERLSTLFRQEGHQTARTLVERTLSAARAFSGPAGQEDDMTVAVFKVEPG